MSALRSGADSLRTETAPGIIPTPPPWRECDDTAQTPAVDSREDRDQRQGSHTVAEAARLGQPGRATSMTALRNHENRRTNEMPRGGNRAASVTVKRAAGGTREGTPTPPSSAPLAAEQGSFVPAMTHAYALARELAKPVARGHLTLTEAHASLLATALQAGRTGQLGGYDPGDTFRGLRHVLGLHLEAEQRRRALTEGRIARRLRPLIALRKPSNVLFAEAHDVNGLDGFPFEEPEVNDIAKTAMFWSLPARENSHGR